MERSVSWSLWLRDVVNGTVHNLRHPLKFVKVEKVMFDLLNGVKGVFCKDVPFPTIVNQCHSKQVRMLLAHGYLTFLLNVRSMVRLSSSSFSLYTDTFLYP